MFLVIFHGTLGNIFGINSKWSQPIMILFAISFRLIEQSLARTNGYTIVFGCER